MKVIFIASVSGHIAAFHLPYIKYLQSKGNEVWAASTGEEGRKILRELNVKCIEIPFSRNPIDSQNIKVMRELKKLLETEKFDLIHVHTPVAALLTRVAFRKIQHGKLIYTAHGFHFYKGAPRKNWFIYFTIEKLASKWTDHLITINEEDFKNAHKLFPAKKISFVHGVGVDSSILDVAIVDKQIVKEELGLKSDSVIISYVAELNENKNHQFLLQNWKNIKQKNPDFELLIIGKGEGEKKLRGFVKNNQLRDIHFLGDRRDVPKLLQISDIVTLLSYREGLSKSIMEAMAAGLPCIVTDTRGLRDLVKSNKNGFVVKHENDNDLIEAFSALYENKNRILMGENSRQLVEPFLIENVLEEYKGIYDKVLNNQGVK